MDISELFGELAARAAGTAETVGEKAAREMAEEFEDLERRRAEKDERNAARRQQAEEAFERANREHRARVPARVAASAWSFPSGVTWII
jgi:hypothetical protein